ncbi:MAG: DEAD/DEAH box helicase, partial [Oscillospiraceae bacterium]|nr:DEAD/DEAH box helicase [Oscillospiraceae bacterium]
GKYLPHRSVVIFGGVDQQPQVDALKKGCDILVATPGRLLDLCGQGHISLQELEYFVLDEADRMLDMGFIHDIRRVIKLLPPKRQTLFFSATMPEEIRKLAAGLLTDPVEVAVAPVSSTVDTIRQSVLFTDKAKKRDLLLWLLRDKAVTSALVFIRTKHLADRVARFLKKNGVDADSIHGDKSQGARLRALGDFKSGQCRVLVATDIAARGIDVSGISHVFNYDLPDVPETYVHRIGRTGRAGQEGVAVSFCTAEDAPSLWEIEKLIRMTIPVTEDHPYPNSEPIPQRPEPKRQKGKKKPDKARDRLDSLLKQVEKSREQQMQEQKTSTPAPEKNARPAYKEIDLEQFCNEDHTTLPLPSKVFSSEVQLPGWVAARSGGGNKRQKPKEESLKLPEKQPEQVAAKEEEVPQKKRKRRKKAKPQQEQPAQSVTASAPKKEVFLQPAGEQSEVRSSSRSRRKREPVWIPMNDQPIVTRPQSYFMVMPLPSQEKTKAEPKKKKRRRRPSGKNNREEPHDQRTD